MDERTAKKMMNNIHFSQQRCKYANRKVKEILIDADSLIKKYDEQDGKCYWSGLSLDAKYNYIKYHPFAISVERLDNAKEYTYENTVLVRRLFNLGRMAFPEDEFREVVALLKEELGTLAQ